MSLYDLRNTPAYREFKPPPSYATNPYILNWWNIDLDNLLHVQISKWQWVWYWSITDEIVKITQPAILEEWKKTDPLCSQYAWYSILMNFAKVRADQIGFTKSIRQPRKKVCPLCNESFMEDSLPFSIVIRFGIDRLDFCVPCLSGTIFQETGNKSASKRAILQYLKDLAFLLGRVPTQNFGEGKTDLIDMTYDERLALLKLLKNKPSVRCVKSKFGSWLNALIQAEVLEDGTRRAGRGIQSIAKDGHICHSLGEKTIDEYLFAHDIYHEREPRYPESNYRGDFKIGKAILEYFGLTGNPEYDAKTKEKISLCEKHGISLVALYPKDLISQEKFESKLSIFIQESKITSDTGNEN